MKPIQEWLGTARIIVRDPTIAAEVLEKHLTQAGNIVGLGFFRPARRGYWGRFTVSNFKEEE